MRSWWLLTYITSQNIQIFMPWNQDSLKMDAFNFFMHITTWINPT